VKPPERKRRPEVKPQFVEYEWAKIRNLQPQFVMRGPVVRERPPKELPRWKERKIRHMESPEPIPIDHTTKGRIPDAAPGLSKHPERYNRDVIRDKMRRRYPSLYEAPPPVMAEGEVEVAASEEKRTREYLEARLQDDDPLEWPTPVPPAVVVEEEEAFEIPEDQLTDTDEATHEIRIKPAYYDPHETRAVRLRNQMVRQRCALKDARLRQEEEDEDERLRKRRHTAKQIAPTLRHLEAISEVKVEKRTCADASDAIGKALRGAEDNDFMIRREMRRNDRQSDMQGKKKERGQETRESDRAVARGETNRRLMELWNPR
jgi:hypothetical protein